MVPAKPLPLLVPVTSISSPAAKVSTASSWPTVNSGASAAVDLAAADLDRVVAVGLGRPDLGHDVGVRGDDGDGDDPVVVVPHLGHAELLAQQALHVAFESAHVQNLRA